jgi:hypothetical protein
MIAILESLTENAVLLRSLGDEYDDPILTAIAFELAEDWARTIAHLAEQPGVLVSTMPWYDDALSIPSTV